MTSCRQSKRIHSPRCSIPRVTYNIQMWNGDEYRLTIYFEFISLTIFSELLRIMQVKDSGSLNYQICLSVAPNK